MEPGKDPKVRLSQHGLSYRPITVQHATLLSTRSFDDTREALASAIPPLDLSFLPLLQAGSSSAATAALEALPPLNIFETRGHGRLLGIYGRERNAVQYLIGNPLTASRMTRHQLSAGPYAPLRVLLWGREESEGGGVVFEYDRPVSVFGQVRDGDVEAVAEGLDTKLRKALLAAAGARGLE